MLAQWSLPGQPAGIAPSVQYSRHTPLVGPVGTQPEPGAQSAVGLHATSGGVFPAGRQAMSEGLW